MKLDQIAGRYRSLLTDGAYLIAVGLGLVFFGASIFANYQAIKFAAHDVGSATTDILLDNLPVVNTDIVFSEGAYLFTIFVIAMLVCRPRSAPFALKSLGLLIVTRATFVIMTHLAPYPDHILTDLDKFRYVTAGSDLFFSNHTAIPFLFALMFWREPKLRYLFMFCSVIAALAVIFGHLHYTIDVFSAYFIAYGIYHGAVWFFPIDAEWAQAYRVHEYV